MPDSFAGSKLGARNGVHVPHQSGEPLRDFGGRRVGVHQGRLPVRNPEGPEEPDGERRRQGLYRA